MNTARTVRLSRRSVLMAGVGLGAGLVAGCQQQASPSAPPNPVIGSKTPTSEIAPVVTGRNLSAGRYREVDIVIIRPEGIPPEPIPVCIALHGGWGAAKVFLDYGVPQVLTQIVRDGAPPFAVVAVEGGNWIGNKDDDPHRMLNEDLPGWLDYHDLATTPFSVVGFGEGGSAALNQGRSPGFQAVAAISPTLYSTWDSAQRAKMFNDQAQWERLEPLRHTMELGKTPIGLWCGTEDTERLELTRQLAQKVKAVKTAYDPGGHDDAYFRRAIPEALKFVAGYL
ncbi:alpha/beta hydrolase-fold protein [Actinokineospora terrae]|uniref:Acyl-CoA:diacylglycerol acyltransferase n=1 Tax=Actinokineospora terrae TaxID=155974 RepID=A0A1H9Q865_9PSEU|nr:alpha/beta hydrolase-fold protein [Actinokineospora terrae]SER56089.1 Enterochelin esterase [Actinokineospora terrae]